MKQEVKSMDIHIDRPRLDKPTLEENMAIVDRWIADTSDKLNAFITLIQRERNDDVSKGRTDNR